MAHLEQEHLKVVALNTKNFVLKIFTVYIGSINASQVRVGEIFKEALKQNAAAIIVAHNHPSGDPTPSPEDVAVTHEYGSLHFRILTDGNRMWLAHELRVAG